MFRDHLQVLKSHDSVPRYMFYSFSVATEESRTACHVYNLDVIPLQATSSFHPANGGSLSANHIYGPGHLPATNTNIHIQLHEGVQTFLCFSTLYSRCIHNTHSSVGLGDMTVQMIYLCIKTAMSFTQESNEEHV